MDGLINIFLGRKHNLYFPNMITSTTVTLMQLLTMLDGSKYREAFVILLILTDAIPTYIV